MRPDKPGNPDLAGKPRLAGRLALLLIDTTALIALALALVGLALSGAWLAGGGDAGPVMLLALWCVASWYLTSVRTKPKRTAA